MNKSDKIAQIQTITDVSLGPSHESQRISHIPKTTLMALPPMGMAFTSDVDHLGVPSGFFKAFRNRPK